MTMTAASTPEEGNVSVVVRVRPPNQREQEGNQPSVVQVVDHSILVFDPDEQDTPGIFSSLRGHDGPKRKGKDMKFIFDRVFGESSRQQDVFEHTTKEILDGVLNGYNCSVFAYGATGAGKTHTMLGSEADPGVMYLTMVELYRRIESVKEEKLCEVLISYLEVYNEQIQDLLEPRGTLAIREDPQKGVVIQGLSFHQPKSAEHLLQMLANGNLNRTQHPTDANASSSRSHAVFQIYVKQQDRTASISQDVRVAKMSLIDLAGSERASTTNAKGERLREGANINRSLLALINVINALADAKSKKAHIPYRDSKLTRLLKDSIGGNCRTVMIAAISPSFLSYDDTYNTLKYANRAKEIKLSMKSNVINLDCHISKYAAVCEELKAEVAELKSKLRSYEMRAILPDQSVDVPFCSSLVDSESSRPEIPSDIGSPEQGYDTSLQALSRLSSQHKALQPLKNNREKLDTASQHHSFESTGNEKSLCVLEEPKDNGVKRLVSSLLHFVWKQCEILKRAGLHTPEMDVELQELERLALGDQSSTVMKQIEKEQNKEACGREDNKAIKEEDLPLPSMEDSVSDIKQDEQAPPPLTRKWQLRKRCRREILPDISPSLRSPVVPIKRRRQAESTPTKVTVPTLPSTPEVQVKRPRKSSIPSRSRPTLRSSTNLFTNKAVDSTVNQPSKQSSICTPKNATQTPKLLSHTVTKGRVPLGTSSIQNCSSVPIAALAVRDMNTTFDLSEVPEMDKTITFGTSEFPGWENVPIQHTDENFGKSSDVAVFTMKGLSVKHASTSKMASASKSYSHKRRRSTRTFLLEKNLRIVFWAWVFFGPLACASSSHGGSLGHSRIARLQMSTVKNLPRPPTIAENISCSPRGQSGKRIAKGNNVAFGRSLPAAPMTRMMQLTVAKS
ncbi:kinesin-like protein KIF18B [Rhinophrynus dorsalis]